VNAFNQSGTFLRLVLTFGLAMALTACGATAAHQPADPTPSSSAGGGPTPTASLTPAVVPVCQASSLTAASGEMNGAAGNQAHAIVLTNGSSQACTVEGFPTVQMLSASGQSVATHQTDGNVPAGASISSTPSLVTIAPGVGASFVIQWSDVPGGPQDCPSASELEIDLPGGGGTVTLAEAVDPCGGDLYVSPVLAGIMPLAPYM
jgi:hypothetical protein